ncbi:MAG: alpha-1,2-fucosyltransferase [Akkermansia muciniphila]
MNLHPGRNTFPIVRFLPHPAGGLRGYFQSARYFEGQEGAHPRCALTAEKEPGAVGVHGRDYRRLRDKHRILDPGFLRRAAGHLSSGKNRLVLFSDEPDEAAEMLARVPAFGRFALEIDRGAPCESLRRMTAMEELVMSCSSFSWWGAWLGNTRKVIVPRDWFVGGVEDYRDIYLPHWVTL